MEEDPGGVGKVIHCDDPVVGRGPELCQGRGRSIRGSLCETQNVGGMVCRVSGPRQLGMTWLVTPGNFQEAVVVGVEGRC